MPCSENGKKCVVPKERGLCSRWNTAGSEDKNKKADQDQVAMCFAQAVAINFYKY